MVLRTATCISAIILSACSPTTPTMFTTGGDEVVAERGKLLTWKFDGPALPPDFINVLGQWNVDADATAPSSPGVLRQVGDFHSADFPRLVLRDLTYTDLTVRVRCRPEAGRTDQACGLMFRVQDSDNYFITRANALENNVRLYRVVGGDRQSFASADVPVARGTWHTLEATAQGTRLTVRFNDAVVIEAHDATFAKGKVGLWTKADSVTAFDDLQATAQ